MSAGDKLFCWGGGLGLGRDRKGQAGELGQAGKLDRSAGQNAGQSFTECPVEVHTGDRREIDGSYAVWKKSGLEG